MQLSLDGHKVSTLSDWEKFFIKKDTEEHWKDNHSAKEFANKVLNGEFEKDVSKIKELADIQFVSGEIEKLTRIDSFDGNQRNHDLACIAQLVDEKIALCVEAKAAEDFDKTLVKCLEIPYVPTNKPKRVNNLCRTFFGKDYDVSLSHIYYQILTGLYGTIKYAKEIGVEKCVFIVYQINTKEAKSKNSAKLHLDQLNDFLKASENPLLEKSNSLVKLKNYENIKTYIAFIEANTED